VALPGLASVGVKSLKWQLVLTPLAPEVSLGQALRSYVGGLPLAAITPGRAGEVGRILYLDHPELTGWPGAGAVLLDKLIDLVSLLWWVAVGLWLAGWNDWALAAALCALAGTPLRFWLRVGAGLVERLPLPASWRGRLGPLLMSGQRCSSGRILAVLAVGAVSYGVEWVQYWAAFNFLAPHSHMDLASTVAIMSLVTLAGAAQISFAGLGVREGLTALLLMHRLAPAAAALGAFMGFFCSVAVPGAIGLTLKLSAPADEGHRINPEDQQGGGS
jgi:hypothetical protein